MALCLLLRLFVFRLLRLKRFSTLTLRCFDLYRYCWRPCFVWQLAAPPPPPPASPPPHRLPYEAPDSPGPAAPSRAFPCLARLSPPRRPPIPSRTASSRSARTHSYPPT